MYSNYECSNAQIVWMRTYIIRLYFISCRHTLSLRLLKPDKYLLWSNGMRFKTRKKPKSYKLLLNIVHCVQKAQGAAIFAIMLRMCAINSEWSVPSTQRHTLCSMQRFKRNWDYKKAPQNILRPVYKQTAAGSKQNTSQWLVIFQKFRNRFFWCTLNSPWSWNFCWTFCGFDFFLVN